MRVRGLPRVKRPIRRAKPAATNASSPSDDIAKPTCSAGTMKEIHHPNGGEAAHSSGRCSTT